MSTSALRIITDGNAVKPSTILEELADSTPLLVMTTAFWRNLVAELGSENEALPFVLDLVNRRESPIGLNLQLDADRSRTVWLPPRVWSQDRLMGWVAARREEIESEFGMVDRITVGAEAAL